MGKPLWHGLILNGLISYDPDNLRSTEIKKLAGQVDAALLKPFAAHKEFLLLKDAALREGIGIVVDCVLGTPQKATTKQP